VRFSSPTGVCAASIGGVAEGHAHHIHDRDDALEQITELLKTYRIPADRHKPVRTLALLPIRSPGRTWRHHARAISVDLKRAE
jgi:hypothetical protein